MPNAIEESLKIVPNNMQEAALLQIQAVRMKEKTKGLLFLQRVHR